MVPGATGSTTGSAAGVFPGAAGASGLTGGPPVMGGGMGGPGGSDVTPAIEYIEAHGGGNLAVSSQQGASSAVIADTGGDSVDVVAIGGFSGRESEVSADWLAGRVEAGQIRWVLTTDDSMSPADGRTGSTSVMATVASVCKKVDVDLTSSTTGTSGASAGTATSQAGSAQTSTGSLYDCQGLGEELAAAS